MSCIAFSLKVIRLYLETKRRNLRLLIIIATGAICETELKIKLNLTKESKSLIFSNNINWI